MNGLLNDQVKITRVANAAAAAQTAVNSSIIDNAGFDGCMFIAALGDVASGSVLGLAAQQDDVNAAGGMATIGTALAFTAGASDADNKLMVLDVFRPDKQFLRAALTRTTADAVVDGIIAIQYTARNRPTVHGSTVLVAGEAVAPAEA